MKLLPILLLVFVLTLGVACSSEPPQVPDVPKYTEGEAIGLVQGLLRTHSFTVTSVRTLLGGGVCL